MKRRLIIYGICLLILGGPLLLNSCKKSNPPIPATPVNFVIPPGFPPTTYSFQSNPLTEEGFALGKKLFYDNQLSADTTVSCGSCHQPVAAFTTYEHDRSHGVHHSHTLRNAPGLFNLAWYPYFNQDGSAASLNAVYLTHFTSPTELGETMGNVVSKVKGNAAYRALFKAAFGDDDVTGDRIFRALSQFVVSLVSADSKFDKVLQGKASFDAQEQSGYLTFQDKCAGCHSGALLTDFSFRNTGFETDMNLNDFGRMRVTGNREDSLKFRVPSLRNLEFTSYYTHDGRLSLPRHVIQHYRSGIHQSATLDPSLTNGITLTDAQENNLVQFLRTLSDSTFLNNPRFRP